MRVREIEGKCVREKGIHVERERERKREDGDTDSAVWRFFIVTGFTS